MLRRRGFTLIELLVVIAIIGILAAMLFPVFARARESARKTQCLANVKNIAIGINMYLVDYENFPPVGPLQDKFAGQWFHDNSPRGSKYDPPCNQLRHGDPYLRTPVILDDYIKNRDVWRCPSAKTMMVATTIVPAGRDGYWVNNYVDTDVDTWHRMAPLCNFPFPPGWGGDITDSFKQGSTDPQSATGGTNGAFTESIATNDDFGYTKSISVNDSARYVTCGDCGAQWAFSNANKLAFPDTCKVDNCGFASSCPAACVADWVNCPDTQACGLDADALVKFFNESAYRKTFTRHLGGSNVGFLDGHAKWYPSETIIGQGTGTKDAIFEGGVCPCWWPSPLQ